MWTLFLWIKQFLSFKHKLHVFSFNSSTGAHIDFMQESTADEPTTLLDDLNLGDTLNKTNSQNFSFGISEATLENSYGFKMDLENFQCAKSNIEVQQSVANAYETNELAFYFSSLSCILHLIQPLMPYLVFSMRFTMMCPNICHKMRAVYWSIRPAWVHSMLRSGLQSKRRWLRPSVNC